MDRRERRQYMERLQQQEMGYRVADGGAWLWSFSVEPLQDIIDAPTGPAVEICELLGIPFARLRYALPDEMLSWGLSTALGRTYALSKSGWAITVADLKERLPSLFGSFRRLRSVRESQVDPASVMAAERARQTMVTMEEFVGTAVRALSWTYRRWLVVACLHSRMRRLHLVVRRLCWLSCKWPR